MEDESDIEDVVAAAAFRRLVRHLQHRSDAQNVDLMGLAGFCRNCLSRWIEEEAAGAGMPIEREKARTFVYGMPYEEYKARHQKEASAEQIERMNRSVALNRE